MTLFTQYSIKDTDSFDEHLYPGVAKEIADLQHSLRDIESVHKAEIIISLLKDHSIKAEWLDGNRKLTALLNSGSLSTSNIESLFTSCKQKAIFLSSLKAYITGKFT